MPIDPQIIQVPVDGTSTPVEEKEKKMPLDMNEIILAGIGTAHTEGMRRILENGESASNIVRHASAIQLAEKSAEESKGAEQILNTKAPAA